MQVTHTQLGNLILEPETKEKLRALGQIKDRLELYLRDDSSLPILAVKSVAEMKREKIDHKPVSKSVASDDLPVTH